MESKFEIVLCGKELLPEASRLFDEYRQFYGQNSNITAALHFLIACLEHKKSTIFVAINRCSKDGLGFLQLYPTFSSLSLKSYWILNDIYVDARFRRMGVAKALMERAANLTRDTGASGMSLQTAVSNREAQKLYESLGWRRVDEFYTYVWTPPQMDSNQ